MRRRLRWSTRSITRPPRCCKFRWSACAPRSRWPGVTRYPRRRRWPSPVRRWPPGSGQRWIHGCLSGWRPSCGSPRAAWPRRPPRELSVPVKVSNGVTLDYVDAERFDPHHCAFLASEAEFDAAYARIRSTHWHEGWTRSSRCGEDTVLPVVADQLAPDRTAAWPVARRPEQGWSLLCNGVVLFDDGASCSQTAAQSPRPPLVPLLPPEWNTAAINIKGEAQMLPTALLSFAVGVLAGNGFPHFVKGSPKSVSPRSSVALRSPKVRPAAAP